MASSLFESFSGGIELNYVISCVWCKRQQLTQLVQLGCFHLACTVCLQRKLEDPKPGTLFNCPECDMSCMVPLGGLPDEPLQHKMNQITVIFSNNKPNCKFCEQVNRVSSISSICVTCKINLCERDAKRHQGTPGHKVITHEELFVEPNLSMMLKSKVDICQEHSLEKNYFCQRCQKKICTECGMLNHSDHKKDSLKTIATENRKTMEENIVVIVRTKRKTKEYIRKLEKTLAEIQENYRRSGEKFKQEEKENLQKLNKEVKFKIQQVHCQITEEKKKIKLCHSAESYIKVFLKFSSNSDVIEKYQDILSNLENCEIIGDDKGACSLSDKMQGIRWNGNVYETKDFLSGIKGKPDLTLNETKEIETKEQSMLLVNENVNATRAIERKRLNGFELEAKWEHDFWPGLFVCENELLVVGGQRMKWLTMSGTCKKMVTSMDLGRACDIEMWEGEVYVCDMRERAIVVFDRNGKMKKKLFLPESENGVLGELSLAFDNKNIYVSSKETNTVYKWESERKQFIPWVVNGLNSPRYLCVTPDHHLVVSNSGSAKVIKYNPQGELVWSYGSKASGKGQLSSPCGVCTDSFGQIFIADTDNNKIVVVSENGQHLMNLDIGEEIVMPWALSLRNERIVIITLSEEIYVIKGKYS